MQIETDHLLLRPPRLSDVPRLYEFLGDAEAMRHTHVDFPCANAGAASPCMNGAGAVTAVRPGLC